MVTLITEKLRLQKLHDDDEQFSVPSFRVEKIVPSSPRAATGQAVLACEQPRRTVDEQTAETRQQWRHATRKKKPLTQRLGKCSVVVAPVCDPQERVPDSHRLHERLGSAGSAHSCCSDSGVSGLTSPGPASADGSLVSADGSLVSADGSLVSDGFDACDEIVIGSPANDPPIKRYCRSLFNPELEAHARLSERLSADRGDPTERSLTVLGQRSQMLRPQAVRANSKTSSRPPHHTNSPRQRSRHQSAGSSPALPRGGPLVHGRSETPTDRLREMSGYARPETGDGWRPVNRDYSPLPFWQQGSASVDCLSVVGLGLGSERAGQAFHSQLNRSLSQDADDTTNLPDKHDVSCCSETGDSLPNSPLRQPTQRCKSQPSLQQLTPRAKLKRRRHERPSINFAKMSETCIERSHRKRLHDSQPLCLECERSYCTGASGYEACSGVCTVDIFTSAGNQRGTRRPARCSNTPSMLSLPENLEESDSGCSDNEQKHVTDTGSDGEHVTSLSEMNAEIDLDQMEND